MAQETCRYADIGGIAGIGRLADGEVGVGTPTFKRIENIWQKTW
jgi:hypothetical protein